MIPEKRGRGDFSNGYSATAETQRSGLPADRILGTSVVKTVFVLNHIDRVSNPAEIRTAVEYVRNSLGTIYTDLAHSLRCAGSEHLASELLRYAIDIPVFTVSAKQMLRSCSAGKEIEGDKDGLRSEVLALVTPEVRIQTILNGVVGQAYGLVFKLHREAEEQCALYGAERDRVASELQKDGDVLRKTLEAMQQALAKVESQRTLLKSDADDAVEEVFRNASAGLPARIESHGLEKGAQVIQQEIARGLESRMEALNERIQRLATECARHAASFIAVRPSSPRIELTSHNQGRKAATGSLTFKRPVNRVASWFCTCRRVLVRLGRIRGGGSALRRTTVRREAQCGPDPRDSITTSEVSRRR